MSKPLQGRLMMAAGAVAVLIPGGQLVGAMLIISGAATVMTADPGRNPRGYPTSPNNQLGPRSNQARLGGRIADIFGTVRAYPDLIAATYRYFDGNQLVEIAFLCLGRGSFLISEASAGVPMIRDGDTRIDQIEGASAYVYGPGQSPNNTPTPPVAVPAGTTPTDSEGRALRVLTVQRCGEVNGQILLRPNLPCWVRSDLNGGSDIQARPGGILALTEDSSLDWTQLYTKDQIIKVGTPATGSPANAGGIDLSGTYTVERVTATRLYLLDAATVNPNWNDVHSALDFGAGTALCIGYDYSWVGPFFLTLRDANQVFANLSAPGGLYMLDRDLDGAKPPQRALSVPVEIEVTQTDVHGTVLEGATPQTYLVTLHGSPSARTGVGETAKVPSTSQQTPLLEGDWTTNPGPGSAWEIISGSASVSGQVLTVSNGGEIRQSFSATAGDYLFRYALDPSQYQEIPAGEGGSPTYVYENRKTRVTLGTTPGGTDLYDVTSDPPPLAGYGSIEAPITLSSDATLYVSIYGLAQDVIQTPGTEAGGALSAYTGGFTLNAVPMTFRLVEGPLPAEDQPVIGPCRVRIRNTLGRTDAHGEEVPWDDAQFEAYEDRIQILDLYAVAQVAQPHFGDVTTVLAKTYATRDAMTVKERKLNVLCTRKVPHWTAGDVTASTPLVASTRLDDIVLGLCIDPRIGRMTKVSESEASGFAAAVAEILAYFPKGASVAGSSPADPDVPGGFCGTFDDDNVSFEEMLGAVAATGFCTVRRDDGKLRLVFEKATDDSICLFNHRTKVPRTEVKSPRFGNQGIDGVEVPYTSPLDDSPQTYAIPEDGSAQNPKKFQIAGLRSRVGAYYHAWRERNRIRFQRIGVEFEATEEADELLPGDHFENADGTRPETQDGDVVAVAEDGVTLTLSQDVEVP